MLLNSGLKSYGFLYKWVELSTNKWYIGSRTAKNSHINDGYICSSKIKNKIIKYPENWIRTILAVGCKDYIRNLEAEYLKALDAKNTPMSYNMHNGDGKFTTSGVPAWNVGLTKETDARVLIYSTKIKIFRNSSDCKFVSWNKGLTKETDSKLKEMGEKISKTNTGNLITWNKGLTKNSSEEVMKVSQRMMGNTLCKGIPKSEETKIKMRKPKSESHKNSMRKPKVKSVCRIFDKLEMYIGNFTKWVDNMSNQQYLHSYILPNGELIKDIHLRDFCIMYNINFDSAEVLFNKNGKYKDISRI